MRIGELARRAGVSERALRYYENQGLLQPARRPSGYREYSEGDLDTVRDIRTLLAAGLNTATIAEVLPCTIKERGQLATPCDELVEVLVSERRRIDDAVQHLLDARAILDGIIAASEAAAPAGCHDEPAAADARLVA